MARAPVSVCIISRDDPHLEHAIASVRDWVEEVCVLQTGPDECTEAIARRLEAKHRSITACNDAQARMSDFALARNESFAMATQPWVMWIDSDDVVAGADSFVELCQAPRGSCYLFPYEYAYDGRGRVITRQYRERLVHGKEAMHWLYPVHEVLVAKAPGMQFLKSERVTVKHQRQYLRKLVEPGRNLRILADWMRTHPDDVRNRYYYGLELGNNGDQVGAIRELNAYLDVSGWADERAMAFYQLERIHESRREYDKALTAAFGSLRTVDWFESYYAICRCFYFQQNWARCVHYGEIALHLPPTQTFLFLNDADRDDIRTMLSVAHNALGNVEEAYAHCVAGLAANPDEPHLQHNLPLFERALGREPAIAKPEPARDGGLRIAFATGPGAEPWDPSTAAKGGIGGSETMLIAMARGLRSLGHEVTVYASPPRESVHDGVSYRDVRSLRNVTCDVLVVSRYAELLDAEYNVAARLRLLWCHDVVAHGATPGRLLRADRVLALSDWHRRNLIAAHNLPPEQVVQTRNGVDLGRFSGSPARKPWVINSSSPDRAWPVLLEEWPRIRAAVPEAELHLFYGFTTWDAGPWGPPEFQHMMAQLKRLVSGADRIPGVTFHGRVDQATLADHMLQSTLWAHPTWFTETSCITAMEAKAAGLHIVTSNLAALQETAKGGVLLDGEWTSPEYRARFVEECVRALRAGPHGPWPDAYGFDLTSLAEGWDRLLRELLVDVERRPVLPYQPSRAYAKGISP